MGKNWYSKTGDCSILIWNLTCRISVWGKPVRMYQRFGLSVWPTVVPLLQQTVFLPMR